MSSNTFDWPNLAVFKGLPQNYLHLLARTETVERYEPRELIFHEGDEADRFFIIVEGTVAIEIFTNERGPVTIQTIGAGEILGWSWLVEPYRWHFDAQDFSAGIGLSDAVAGAVATVAGQIVAALDGESGRVLFLVEIQDERPQG